MGQISILICICENQKVSTGNGCQFAYSPSHGDHQWQNQEVTGEEKPLVEPPSAGLSPPQHSGLWSWNQHIWPHACLALCLQWLPIAPPPRPKEQTSLPWPCLTLGLFTTSLAFWDFQSFLLTVPCTSGPLNMLYSVYKAHVHACHDL